MNDNEIKEFINAQYEKALDPGNINPESLSAEIKGDLDLIASSAENAKAVLAVVLTSLVYKALHPEQDIRRHQAQIEGGYAGRIFDGKYITPFLRAQSFPNMAESGWLTRSFEQPAPYDEQYPGKITPKSLKLSFLDTLKRVQQEVTDYELPIQYLFRRLVHFRDNKQILIACPQNLTINAIIDVLTQHFSSKYSVRGASRLPVLALYAIYQALMNECRRFEGKTLLPLENHTSADSQSGMLGDLEVVDSYGKPFEGVEVKGNLPITVDFAERAKDKIMSTPVSRYYILSCMGIKPQDAEAIDQIVTQVKNTHGCQIIVNGVIPSIRYYLRLLETPAVFIQNYTRLLGEDETIKYEHRAGWNRIISHL